MDYNHYKVEIDGRDCTVQVPFPIKFSQLLDEQLDEASISVIRTRRKNFKPLTPVTITLWNGETAGSDVVLNMLVASDNAKELPIGSGKFNHELYLIEETKLLEGHIVRSLGFVNALEKTGVVVYPTIEEVSYATENWEPPKAPLVWDIYSPISNNKEIYFPSGYDLYGDDALIVQYISGGKTTTTDATRVTIYKGKDEQGNDVLAPSSDITLRNDNGEEFSNSTDYIITTKFSCIFHTVGNYKVVYQLSTGSRSEYGNYIWTYNVIYNINVVEQLSLTTKKLGYNARSVVERALFAAEFIRKDTQPRFALNGNAELPNTYVGEYVTYSDLPTNVDEGSEAWVGTSPDNGYAVKYYNPYGTLDWLPTAETFEQITGLSGTAAKLQFFKTPEFQFTQSTLREILQGVGSFIHAEPRLKNGLIFYDFYGSGEESKQHFSRYASQQLQLNIERFATGIDSTVDNLTNSLGYAVGTVIEPYNGGFKNVITESSFVRVDETNCFVGTQSPIRRIIKVECYSDEIDGTSPSNPVDITSHVLEIADYNQLSSYNGELAKANALYYSVGEKGIRGLNTKLNTAVFQQFQNYAILNIIALETGTNIPIVNPPNIANIKFRVTYEPLTKTRAKQSKAIRIETHSPREIIYNQGQNMIESRYYGEHLKGVVARIGNIDKTLTVIERGLVLPPPIGTIYEIADGDYYVSSTAVEVNANTTKITIALSKDYNKYSDYIGIDSMKRQYEISEKQAFDSFYHYRDFCVVGDYESGNDTDVLFAVGSSKNVPLAVSKIITQKAEEFADTNYIDKKISFATINGVDFNGNPLNKILLPVVAYPLGNSAVFTCRYEDNYSAGMQVVEKEVDSNMVNFTNGTQYTDGYGEVELFNIAYFSDVNWGDMAEGKDALIDRIAKSLPAAIMFNPSNAIMGNIAADGTADNNPLLAIKGSTEVPSITYQLDFVSNRKGIVIGSALAKNLPMVSGVQSGHYAVLYVLPKRLNKFDKTVDLSGATKQRDYDNDGIVINDYRTISFNPQPAITNGKAWALVDNATGELLVGENREIVQGNNIFGDNGLHISFAHDIYSRR